MMTPVSAKARKRGEDLAAFLDLTPVFATFDDYVSYLYYRDCGRYRIIEWAGVGMVEFQLPKAKARVMQDAAARRPAGMLWVVTALPWWRRRMRLGARTDASVVR